MKRFAFLLIGVVLLTGCVSGSSRVSQRAVEGGAIGALLGWGIGGGGRDAAAGAAVGAVAGAVVGVFEERSIRHEPTPLPWLEGERVAVYSGYGGSWRDGVRAIVEDGLRGRGAVLVAPVGRRYYSDYDRLGATYLVEVSTARQGYEAVVMLRVIDRTDNVVRAMSEGRYYYGRFYRRYRHSEYNAFANAAEEAVESLH